MTRLLASLALAGPTLLAAQAVSPPGGNGPIYRHPASRMIALFDRLCVRGGDLEAQKRAAHGEGFRPVISSRSEVDLHWQSIGFSVRDVRQGRQCTVGGLTDRVVSADEVGKLSTSLKLAASQAIAVRLSKQGDADTSGLTLTLITTDAVAQ